MKFVKNVKAIDMPIFNKLKQLLNENATCTLKDQYGKDLPKAVHKSAIPVGQTVSFHAFGKKLTGIVMSKLPSGSYRIQVGTGKSYIRSYSEITVVG
jgi:hypothetical protein